MQTHASRPRRLKSAVPSNLGVAKILAYGIETPFVSSGMSLKAKDSTSFGPLWPLCTIIDIITYYNRCWLYGARWLPLIVTISFVTSVSGSLAGLSIPGFLQVRRECSYHLTSSDLISTDLISSELSSLWLVADELGRTCAVKRPGSPWLRPITSHSVQMMWGRMRWGDVRWDEWYDHAFCWLIACSIDHVIDFSDWIHGIHLTVHHMLS